MSDVTCEDCGEVMDQSDVCRHACGAPPRALPMPGAADDDDGWSKEDIKSGKVRYVPDPKYGPRVKVSPEAALSSSAEAVDTARARNFLTRIGHPIVAETGGYPEHLRDLADGFARVRWETLDFAGDACARVEVEHLGLGEYARGARDAARAVLRRLAAEQKGSEAK